MIEQSKPLIQPDGHRLLQMNSERWLEMYRYMKSAGVLESDLSLDEVYTNEYLPN
jgi:hypothetical protein